MKKLYYVLFFSVASLLLSCHSNNISKINTGAKVIGQCCSKLSISSCGTKDGSMDRRKETLEERISDDSSLLPFYSWDTKLLIW